MKLGQEDWLIHIRKPFERFTVSPSYTPLKFS